MSETHTTTTDTPAKATAPQLSIRGIYLRHLSFETARSLMLLGAGLRPEMKMEVRVDTTALKEDQEEVVVDLTITARANRDLLYCIQVQQAGCFVLRGLTEEQKAFHLHTTCATVLYPYACQVANNLSVQGGFAAANPLPIDFVHFYAQHRAQSAEKADREMTASPASEQTTSPKNKWAELAVSVD